MTKLFMFALAALLLITPVSASGIVERAEKTELRRSDGTLTPRVIRNKQGHVIRVVLSKMELSSKEMAELGRLEHLQSLVLFRTKVTDADVTHLKNCRTLRHLNLTGTEVTDAAIETILDLEKLTSLCLGNVKVTPEGIEKLKVRNRTHDLQLRWGYSQRVEPTTPSGESKDPKRD